LRKFSRYQLVHDFIKAFKAMPPGHGDDVVSELEDFCQGYRDSRSEVWKELLSLDVEKVIGEASGATLAETMTHAKIKPGHFNRGRA